jgi:L-lactate dehydrogenase complex protein LldG
MSREQFFAALRIAEIGVSSADLAVAETGTLIMTTSDDMERLVTALPRTHVAVLPHSRLVNSIADAATYVTGILTENNTRGTISLISGTSSTADIGGLVVSGVHGPKNLYVCLLDRELLGST